MENKELIIKSAAYLKKAVPLMMRYQVPTTPLNYSLWYSYVANDIPELNSQLEKLIVDRDVCPPVQAESLYREFVADKSEANTWALRQSIEKMLTEFGQTLADTSSDTDKFQQTFDKTFVDILRVEEAGFSVEEVLILLKKLEKKVPIRIHHEQKKKQSYDSNDPHKKLIFFFTIFFEISIVETHIKNIPFSSSNSDL